MGIYTEKNIPRWAGVMILIAAFLALYQPWQLTLREFFGLEGLYAVEASELDPTLSIVTAHGVAIQNTFPLFPALAALVVELFGVPMELALRGLSLLMLAATAVIVYIAAASERSSRAGLVAAAMYISTFLALEKAGDGYPATMSAFFLLAAQLTFFQFGVRRVNWNAAWVVSLLLLALGFYSGGFLVILYFVFPMLFFRRPLSVKSKFRKPGFIVGLVLIGAAILAWGIPYWVMSHRIPFQYVSWTEATLGGYLKDLLLFPLMLPLRLLPWAVIGWIPFCVALQALDTTPILSRYLRTLALSTLALLWLLPGGEPREILFLLGPLSILVGINYELGMRRYGLKVRKVLVLGEYFAVAAAVAIGVVCFAPGEWLETVISISNSLAFRDSGYFRISAALAGVIVVMITVLLSRGRLFLPIWLFLLLVTVAGGVFYGSVMLPYRAQERNKREFGAMIAAALARETPGRLYKSNILDLYGEIYYAGVGARKIQTLEELPADEPVVYLLSTEFPLFPDRNWTNLLAPGYTYRSHRLALWKGELRPREE